tara:strand:- start:975 stop:1169 length:195 start_codon:yes stop_codon:yes gene_type:complete
MTEYRKCDQCNVKMYEGYYIGADTGEESYYCSDECLYKNYTKEQYEKMHYEDEHSFWTSFWDDE